MARLAALLVLLVAVANPAAGGDGEHGAPWSRQPIEVDATLGYHYSTGKYGGSERTDIMFVPFTAGATYDSWTLRLTVPWISVEGGAGGVDPADGSVILGEGDGLGDIALVGVYTIFPARDWAPFVDIGGRIKFPTADENRGLGTGKFDYEINVEVSKVLGKLTPFAQVGYRFVGEPDTYSLDDAVLASLGSLYRIHPRSNAGVFLYFQQSSSVSADDQLDLMPYVDWRLTPHWSASAYATVGLLPGSPDFGIGIQLTYRRSY